MKREVFVLMQGMSHKNISFKSILCMCISYNSKEVTLRGHIKKRGREWGLIKYSTQNDTFFIVL